MLFFRSGLLQKKFVLQNMNFSNEKVSLLETKQSLHYNNKGKNVEILLPEFDPNKMKSEYAYIIKIEGVK